MSEQTTLVRVTGQHIADGVVKDCERCPVALALVGALGDLFTPGSWVDVDPLAITFFPDCEPWPVSSEIWEAATPDVAAGFIERFDERETDPGGPFEFTLTWHITRFAVGRPW